MGPGKAPRDVSTGAQMALAPDLVAPEGTESERPRRRGPNRRTRDLQRLVEAKGLKSPVLWLAEFYNADLDDACAELRIDPESPKARLEVRRMQVSAAIAAQPYLDQKLPPMAEGEQAERFLIIGDVATEAQHALGELGFEVRWDDDGKAEVHQTLGSDDVSYTEVPSDAAGSDDDE